MSNHDDLADLIEATWWAMPSPADHIWEKLADSILAAGWRPPAREITTAEELDDDCNAVWASTREDESRRVWVRSAYDRSVWRGPSTDADYALTPDLIDPKPVPEEER